MKNYDDYIVFVLGSDNTHISRTLQDEIDVRSDLYWGYETAIYIAEKFQEYDQRNVNTQSQLDSYYDFLTEYEDELLKYILDDVKFEIRSDKDEF